MHRPQPAIVFAFLVIGALLAPRARAQSLADAARKAEEAHAAATKKATDESKPSDKSTDEKKKGDDPTTEKKPSKTYTNKDLKDASPSLIQASSTNVAPDAATSTEPDSIAENRIAAAALLDKRLTALSAGLRERDQTAARYQDACAGKETSAGWLLKGQLITTPNAETPACRTMASDLARQTSAYNAEHAAIVESARVSRILPGVLRDIFAAHHIPE